MYSVIFGLGLLFLIPLNLVPFVLVGNLISFPFDLNVGFFSTLKGAFFTFDFGTFDLKDFFGMVVPFLIPAPAVAANIRRLAAPSGVEGLKDFITSGGTFLRFCFNIFLSFFP